MRLLPGYRETMLRDALQVFGPDVTVWLFGSRTDDTAKGGDIDLLIQLAQSVADKTRLALQYETRLQMHLGLQKFDVLVIDPQTPLLPIHRQALQSGIRL